MTDLSRQECEEKIGHCWIWGGSYEYCQHCGKARDDIFQDEVDALTILEELKR